MLEFRKWFFHTAPSAATVAVKSQRPDSVIMIFIYCLFSSAFIRFSFFWADFLFCQSTCLHLFFSYPLVCATFLSVTSLYLFVCLCVSGLVCFSPVCLRVSRWDPRLSMQPVMRCMLQSACEELIRKQQRPSHINRHACVCVCLGRVWRLGSLPGTLTAVCRPTGLLIRRGRQKEMNSDL